MTQIHIMVGSNYHEPKVSPTTEELNVTQRVSIDEAKNDSAKGKFLLR